MFSGKYKNAGKILSSMLFGISFIQGWNSYDINFENNTKKPLLAQKFIRGTLCGTMDLCLIPLSVYKDIGQIEIYLTRKDPYNYPEFFKCGYFYTTLQPKPNTNPKNKI